MSKTNFKLNSLTFRMLVSLLSRPCTSSTAKLSVCKEGVPLGAPFSEETVERSISPSRSAIDICRGTEGLYYVNIIYQPIVPRLNTITSDKRKHVVIIQYIIFKWLTGMWKKQRTKSDTFPPAH